jgi:hypothetical protein
MVFRPPNIASLIDAVLEERAEAISFSPEHIDAQAKRLRAGFARIRENALARRRIVDVIERLPASRRAGWLEGVQSAFKVVLGEARRTSRILVDAANGLLPAAPDAWTFAPAMVAATRSGEAAATKAESVDDVSAISRTVIVDDAGPERRVLATITNYPADSAPPVLLVVAEDGEQGMARVIEVDPEIEPDLPDVAGKLRRRLRYEAVLPSGAYYVFFGNPRASAP